MGPATLYMAPHGTTEPAYTAHHQGAGGAVTGRRRHRLCTRVLRNPKQTLTDISVEQLVDPVAGAGSSGVIQVTAALKEARRLT